MLIRVLYHDQKYDFIKATRLEEFIRSGAITMFQRGSGWARVNVDPIRTKNTDSLYNSLYNGNERRQLQAG